MTKNISYKIGSVRLSQLAGADVDSTKYSDGDSEEVLLNLFKCKDPTEKIDSILASKPEWSIYYHLSPYRKNVIEWFDFAPKSEVLEIGAGAGAVTEALCDKDIKVTALELTKRRAEINAFRNKERKNLEIIIGNLEEYKPTKKFDYIVCVGVLEYAGMFINSDNPYGDFIKYISNMLTPNGQLIVAIENRLGLKYLSGAREDHTGRFFDGINQYPYPKKVQTFGRIELRDLIETHGFETTEFFYPYPDYKNPMLIYSEQYHPGKNTEFPIKSLPTKGFDADKRNRVHLFSEQLAMISLEKNQLYQDISNSFIVIAGKTKSPSNSIGFYTNTPLRKAEYQLSTYLRVSDSGVMKFYKEARNLEAKGHLQTIEKNFSKLDGIFRKSNVNIVPVKRVSDILLEFDYIEGTTLERLLFESIVSGSYSTAEQIIDNFIEAVNILPGKSSTENYLIDLNFDNIMVDKEGKWHFIDYEWLLDKKVPKKIIIQRSLLYLVNRYSHAFMFLSIRGDYLTLAEDWHIPSRLYTKYKEYFIDIDELVTEEKGFQSLVNSAEVKHPVTTKELLNNPQKSNIYKGFLEEYLGSKSLLADKIKNLENSLNNSKKTTEELQNQLKEQQEKTRRAELTSPYHLTKKVSRRISKKIRNGKLK